MPETTIIQDGKEVNQIAYFTAPTLPELENKVNHNVLKFIEDNDDDYHYSADIYSQVQFINGEYIQTVQFISFKKLFRPRRKPAAKKKAVKKATTETVPTI